MVTGTALAIKMLAYVVLPPVAAALTERLPPRAAGPIGGRCSLGPGSWPQARGPASCCRATSRCWHSGLASGLGCALALMPAVCWSSPRRQRPPVRRCRAICVIACRPAAALSAGRMARRRAALPATFEVLGLMAGAFASAATPGACALVKEQVACLSRVQSRAAREGAPPARCAAAAKSFSDRDCFSAYLPLKARAVSSRVAAAREFCCPGFGRRRHGARDAAPVTRRGRSSRAVRDAPEPRCSRWRWDGPPGDGGRSAPGSPHRTHTCLPRSA